MIYLEVLNPKNKEIFSLLKNFADFYLAGGTALALQLGHRKSVDFDLFSSKIISNKLLKQVEEVFKQSKIQVLVNNSNELAVLTDGIKITFLYYPFEILDTLVDIEGLKLLSIKEIAATKAYTIGRRGSFKDYVDLYLIIKGQQARLGEIIKMARRKYGGIFNDRLFLEQLLYLEDVQDFDILFLREKITKSALKEFFTKEVEKVSL